jgi:hypothetical protein
MPTQLQLRRGTTTEHSTFSGAVGEVTVDTTKDTLIVHDGATNGGFPLAKEAGATFGNTNVTGNFSFADNAKAIFGAGSDLQIYHDGADSIITEQGTGSLYIGADTTIALTDAAVTQNKAQFITGGAVNLFHNNALKFATTATGVDVTGNATFPDNGKAIFGAGNDLQIYHDSNDSYINDTGTGNLRLAGSANVEIISSGGEFMAKFVADGASTLYYDNAAKLATTSTGVDVTGGLSVDGGTIKLDGNYPVGSGNVALGDTALDSLTSGNQNTAVGNVALTANTTGLRNTAVGSNALETNVSSEGNTAIGYAALYLNTGASNVAVGRSALENNASGAESTAVGYQAGYNNSTGRVTAMGRHALKENTTAAGNTGIGYRALRETTTGQYNTALGDDALLFNTTANYNTAIGYQAGYTGTESGHNTYIGYQAGYLADYGSAANTYNTFVGSYAGSAITLGAKNVIIGGYNGNGGGLDIRTSSNNIVLSDGDGFPRMYTTGNSWSVLGQTSTSYSGFDFKNNANTLSFAIGVNNAAFYIFDADASHYVSYAQDGTSWGFSSDRRLKENIVDIDYGLETILAVRPKRFNFITSGKEDIGFIAQDLKEVIPEAVQGEELEFLESDTAQEKAQKSLKISKDSLIPVLVKAIQEQQATITALTARIEALEA